MGHGTWGLLTRDELTASISVSAAHGNKIEKGKYRTTSYKPGGYGHEPTTTEMLILLDTNSNMSRERALSQR